VGDVDELVVHRGWLSAEELERTINSLAGESLSVGDVELVHPRRSDQSRYTWSFQDYFSVVKKRIGWPGLGLRGSGDVQDFACGYDVHRRLSRRLAALKPRSFGSWASLAEFLALGGEPLDLGDSKPVTLECFAPMRVRFADVNYADSTRKGMTAQIDFLTDTGSADFHLLLDSGGSSEGHQIRPESSFHEGSRWQAQFDRPDRPESSALCLVLDGQVVDQVRVPGNIEALHEQLDGAWSASLGHESAASPSSGSSVSEALTLGLHPLIRQHCASLLATEHYDEAITKAFTIVEDSIRTKVHATLEEIGRKLVARAMGGDSPQIVLSPVKPEQEAGQLLYQGGIGFLKNPRSHRLLKDPDRETAQEATAFASLLLRILDNSPVRSNSPDSDRDRSGWE